MDGALELVPGDRCAEDATDDDADEQREQHPHPARHDSTDPWSASTNGTTNHFASSTPATNTTGIIQP